MQGEFLRWRDEWSLNVEELDSDHRDAAAILNEVAELCGMSSTLSPGQVVPSAHKPDPAKVLGSLKKLDSHVRRHFEREDAFMKAIDYPDFDSHHFEHVELLAELAELLRSLVNPQGECLDRSLLSGIKTWLVSHMVSSDRALAEYYHRLCGGVRQSERMRLRTGTGTGYALADTRD